MILHVTTSAAWNTAIQEGAYRADSLNTEGFIHCCLEQQLPGVLQRYYSTGKGLVVLYIDEQKLMCPVQYEPSPVVPGLFPHVYGLINLAAVQSILPIDP